MRIESVMKSGTGKRAMSSIRNAYDTAVPSFQVLPRTLAHTAEMYRIDTWSCTRRSGQIGRVGNSPELLAALEPAVDGKRHAGRHEHEEEGEHL